MSAERDRHRQHQLQDADHVRVAPVELEREAADPVPRSHGSGMRNWTIVPTSTPIA